jgi:S-adenosylmethionine/arginine decarboxylase-like enzyme
LQEVTNAHNHLEHDLMLNHRHILFTARGLANPPATAAVATDWLRQLTDLVGMKVLFGPEGRRCDTPGNEGVTGLVCIETSHAAIHCWDTDVRPFAQGDLYSCAHFDIEIVLQHLLLFEPCEIDYLLIDRNDGFQILQHGLRVFPEP